MDAFLQPLLHFAFQLQNMKYGEDGQRRPAYQRYREQRELQASKQSAQLQVATPQGFFVQRLDAVGDLQHRRSAGNEIFVKKSKAVFVAFVRGPREGMVKDLPIGLDLRPQILEWRRFFGIDVRSV